jgi:hypothetical protein
MQTKLVHVDEDLLGLWREKGTKSERGLLAPILVSKSDSAVPRASRWIPST